MKGSKLLPFSFGQFKTAAAAVTLEGCHLKPLVDVKDTQAIGCNPAALDQPSWKNTKQAHFICS